MEKIPVNFFFEDISFRLKDRTKLKKWIAASIKNEKQNLSELNFIFCTDKYLLPLNREFLKHNTLTDVITFNNSEETGIVTGEIYISFERVKENTLTFKTTLADELHRVMIHGVLHLCGYIDKTVSDKNKIRTKENFYLAKRKFKK